jgi:hypothetical protein
MFNPLIIPVYVFVGSVGFIVGGGMGAACALAVISILSIVVSFM